MRKGLREIFHILVLFSKRHLQVQLRNGIAKGLLRKRQQAFDMIACQGLPANPRQAEMRLPIPRIQQETCFEFGLGGIGNNPSTSAIRN